jgi:hypothetical protein
VSHLLEDDGGRVELPVAIVSGRNPDRTLEAIRVYHSMWPLTGGHRARLTAPLRTGYRRA